MRHATAAPISTTGPSDRYQPMLSDADLYWRGTETLLASWEQYARGATAAAVKRFPGVAAAVFPSEPERSVYNNAVLERDLGADERTQAVDSMEAAYQKRGRDPLRRLGSRERPGYAVRARAPGVHAG